MTGEEEEKQREKYIYGKGKEFYGMKESGGVGLQSCDGWWTLTPRFAAALAAQLAL